jgi:hypothetical protein
MDLSAGTSNSEGHSMLCGRFELMREEPATTGVQLFGPTLAVLDTQTGEPARACVLDAALLPTPADRAAFVRALGELADLQEPALVPQVFVGEDGERVVVCYDPLQGALALRDIDDGPRSSDLANELSRLASHLARALAALHGRGRVHGMLACEAVFVGPNGPAAFQHGFAPLCARDELARRWSSLDPSRLAPEVLAGGDFTPAADTYAWGVALAEFATGLRGSAALRAPEPPGLPTGLWALISACVAADAAARPRDGAELVRRLDVLASGAPEPASESPVVSLLSPPPAAEPPAPEPPVSEALSDPPGSSEPAPSDSSSPARQAPVELADIPVTSLEELLINEGSFRPNTVAALRPVAAPPPAPTAPASSGAAAISGGQAQESGSRAAEPPGRSHSGLRRVHVLTEDSIVRRPPISRPDIVIEPEPASAESPASSRDSDPRLVDSDPRLVAAVPDTPAPAPKPASQPAPAPASSAPAKPSPAKSGPVKAAEPAAPKSSDRSFWIVMAALVLAVVLAWAFT